MSGWAICVIGYISLELGSQLILHGKQKEGNHNFIHQLIGWGILVFFLFKAGIFS